LSSMSGGKISALKSGKRWKEPNSFTNALSVLKERSSEMLTESRYLQLLLRKPPPPKVDDFKIEEKAGAFTASSSFSPGNSPF
jgi:hypothetical protein